MCIVYLTTLENLKFQNKQQLLLRGSGCYLLGTFTCYSQLKAMQFIHSYKRVLTIYHKHHRLTLHQ